MGEIAEQEKRVAELRHSRGEEHPETLTAMLDLAELLWKEGRLRLARVLEEQVVAARLRLFGEKHPDTLKAMGKLATTIGMQGDLATARALQARIVELAPEVWGEDGRDRWRALNNLAGTVAAETSAPSGPGPTSQEPESAQITSGSAAQPIAKLPGLIGAKPRCPFGHKRRRFGSAERRS
ncbi:MAG: hypothetical protein AUG47_00165 [Alphaproteobacteria bacterium 13_1_20CM_3_64_12]|nr:MAG: hypothetical protein AUG47_00165 [Alphaproteobacteria bacterium 13_1_20CM_3_64_12]